MLTALLVAVAPAAEAGVVRGPIEVHRGFHERVRNHGVRYVGRAYYRPHHHYHRIYNFPVVVGGVVSYRPYDYCDDRLFVGAFVPLPRVVIGLNVTSGRPVYR